MGCCNPISLIGSNPLFRGKKAPPQPEMAPQKMGPNKAMSENSEGGMALAAALVKVQTTLARLHSYKTMSTILTMFDLETISRNMG